MDSHDADLPDHPEDPFPPREVAPPVVDEDAEDFVDDENEEDDEATLDEEEGLLEDDDDELDDLEAEADMDIEELRKKYGYGAPAPTDDDEPCVSSTAEEAEEEEEAMNSEAIESAANNYFGVGESNEAEEEDVDYEPPEKKEFQIRVDPLLYQAVVPEGTEGADSTAAEHAQGVLLWSPREDVTSEALNRFVHEWKARRHGVETDETKIDSRDDEDALFCLLSSAYSTVAAAEAFPGAPANQCQLTIEGEPKEFSAEEKLAFETGFKDNYKNFRVIRESFVPSRTLGELINYYYHWKKTPRFGEFRRTLQRKDFMTEVMDQMEGRKQRREAASAAAAAEKSADAASTTIPQLEENDEDEIEYEDPMVGSANDLPADLYAALPPPPQHEQPTESA
ncbi:hypothetical protein PENTCL1PPCAC_5071 [Pristionchus entomophagus]|uniref:Mesoderm induction early response protein 1 n=1 Tax=Pristionchus entomophagus TaxID=358040 RepID=A0AAV5STP0_9BILA|nr:hypothetical protein PENTCL1PPCAC_5071 [Pristionchus entomophagus]